jgi:hypothetical protein
MKYIEISSRGEVSILKIKNIDGITYHSPSGTNKFHQIRFDLKRGNQLLASYETKEKMMEEYRNIRDKLLIN